MGVEPGKPAQEAPAVVLRPATYGDLDYIYSTWLRSYLQHGVTLGWARSGGQAAKARYFRGQQALIAELLRRAHVMVAGMAGDEVTILGWACWEPPREPAGRVGGVVLHYIYTRQAVRRAGVGRALLSGLSPTEYTHLCQAPRGERGRGAEWSDWLAEWMRRDWPLAVYNPYAVHGG